ncbi:BnaA07g09360D [Brassica napus]|uniref:Uncharacterized protein n=2 Tax=Brassica TaxID=3705 RepID=M4D7I2_BRACM|nr:unnamed protein product [Brassica napus]CDY40264.1 BnaA07g09360D [Brassica napus]
MTLPHLAQVLERYSAAMFLRNNETTRAQVLQQPNYSGLVYPLCSSGGNEQELVMGLEPNSSSGLSAEASGLETKSRCGLPAAMKRLLD